VEYVLRHASNLHHIEFVLDDELNPEILSSALKSLIRLNRTPRVSFDRRPSTDGEHPALGVVIQQFKDKLTIVKLDAKASQADLQYVAGFHQLERLNVYSTSEFHDLRRFLSGIPLIKLTVVVQCDDLISSLPSKLRILRLYLFRSSLFHETWSAVCGLKHLEELIILCDGVEDGPPCRFNSSNLRTFEFSVDTPFDTPFDANLAHQTISSVLENSSPSVVEVKLNNLESAFLHPIFTRNYALSSLVISSDPFSYHKSNVYTFEDYLAGVKNTPRLQNAQLPWPTGNSGEGETTQRLSYTHAQEFANAWPNLDEIEFRLRPYLQQNKYSSWSGFDSFTLKIPENMPFDRQKLQFWRLSHWALLQSFKMDMFIDDASPCLNLCTLFFDFGDKNYPDTTTGYRHNICVFLSLKQVRRHAGHLYFFCPNEAESSCGKGCRLLLEGLTSQSVKAKCRSRSCTMLESSYLEACGRS